MSRSMLVAIAIFLVLPSFVTAQEKSRTLLTRIADWQYPDAKMNGATMSDAPTLNSKGERTVASMQCKTVMTTPDPFEKVVDYYRTKLAQNAGKPVAKEGIQVWPRGVPRSVTFHADSDDRPVKIQIISIHTEAITTTLVISRATGEEHTHIAWSEYEVMRIKN